MDIALWCGLGAFAVGILWGTNTDRDVKFRELVLKSAIAAGVVFAAAGGHRFNKYRGEFEPSPEERGPAQRIRR